jgi:HSP20 family molecular chaperone IbpA
MSENPADSPDEPDDDRPRSQHWLETLLSTLDSLDRRRSSLSQQRQNDMRIDYDVSIGSSLDRADDRSGFDRPRTRRRRQPSATTTSLTIRSYEDELVITADVAGVDPDEITVGFDDAALVVGVSGTELDRVDVPWPEPTATATINNSILTVTVSRGSNGGDES